MKPRKKPKYYISREGATPVMRHSPGLSTATRTGLHLPTARQGRSGAFEMVPHGGDQPAFRIIAQRDAARFGALFVAVGAKQ